MKFYKTFIQKCPVSRFFTKPLQNAGELQCSSNIPAAILSPEGIILCVNDALEMYSGYTKKELDGNSVYKLLQGEEQQQWCRRAHRLLCEKKYDILRREFSFLKRDGRTLPLETTLIAIRGRYGKLRYIRYILQDLTHTKENEQKLSELVLRFSLIMKSGNMFPWHYNLETGRISIPEEYQKHADFRQTNYTLEDFAGKIPSGEWSDLSKDIEMLSEGRIERFDREIQVDVNGEGYVWCNLTAVVHKRRPGGKPLSLLGFLVIIQVHKDIELRLERALEKAEESDRLKTRLLANISHEIRTPLNIITGFSALYAENGNDPQAAEYLTILRENSDRFLSMIDNVVTLSRLESEKTNIRDQFANTEELMDLLYTKYSKKLKKNIEFSVKTAPEAPRSVRFNPSLLLRVLYNLIDNALSNTPEGTVSVHYYYSDGYCHFKVTDTGLGIPREKLSLIFERFEKLENFQPGLGLGLTICKTIAEKAKGFITVRSSLGKGSEFTFSFPFSI